MVQTELLAAATVLTRAAPLPGPLTDLRLPSGHTDALRALWVQVRAHADLSADSTISIMM